MKGTIVAFIAKWGIYMLVAALLAVSSFAGLQTVRLAWAQAETAKVSAKFDAAIADAATARANFERDARATERKLSAAATHATDEYERGKIDAQTHADAVVADLRSGIRRMRQEWKCPAAAEVPAVAGTAGVTDAGAELQRASAGRIVRTTDTCQAQVIAWKTFYVDLRAKLAEGKQ